MALNINIICPSAWRSKYQILLENSKANEFDIEESKECALINDLLVKTKKCKSDVFDELKFIINDKISNKNNQKIVLKFLFNNDPINYFEKYGKILEEIDVDEAIEFYNIQLANPNFFKDSRSNLYRILNSKLDTKDLSLKSMVSLRILDPKIRIATYKDYLNKESIISVCTDNFISESIGRNR